jgi:hypothetical protein
MPFREKVAVHCEDHAYIQIHCRSRIQTFKVAEHVAPSVSTAISNINMVNVMCLEYVSVHMWSLICGAKETDVLVARERNVAPTLEGDLTL